MARATFLRLFQGIIVAGLGIACGQGTDNPPGQDSTEPKQKPLSPDNSKQLRIAKGKQLSLKHCAACHVYPNPGVLTQANWREHTLPWMSRWVGLRPPEEGLVDPKGFDRVISANVFPADPLLSKQDWSHIEEFYHQTAPIQLPTNNRPEIVIGLDLFEAVQPTKKFSAAVMTVRINRQQGGLWVVHEGEKQLHALAPNLEWTGHPRQLASTASTIVPSQNGVLATLMGQDWQGSWIPQGALARVGKQSIQSLGPVLHRPTDVLPVDLNQDGREDLVITEHGNILGSVFWLERLERGFKKHTLLDWPGGLNIASGDFNKDQIPDLVILTGQAREAVHLFLSTGRGKFEHQITLERHPAWGHSHIEVLDFNKDGHPDLLITNGDNAEIKNYPPKPYHGIRLHLNDGRNQFNKEFFFPQYGAYRAMAADFDEDGDLDIASIAYFGRHDITPKAGFVFLRQDKPMKFSAHTHPTTLDGRWLSMDVGDIDMDGDFDIALGAMNEGPSQEHFPEKLNARWKKNPVPVLILKNRSR